jgi:hypothetical protein
MLYEDYLQRYFQVWNWQAEQYGRITDRNIDCHGMTEVHIQTYRTASYMLSCAQSYRPGKPGYQQHPWQATLGLEAVVFTNHPGSDDEKSRPNFWAGNGILPRAAQHKNVLICIHHIPGDDAFPFSHAYFPKAAFDEVAERGHWVFGRKGEGYIGLFSQHPLTWHEDQHAETRALIELRADSPANAWIVEMGEASHWDSFAQFVEAVSSAPVSVDGLEATYHSPTLGVVEFGWHSPLRVEGAEVELHNYPRFDNPYCQAEFGTGKARISYQGEIYNLDGGGDGS